MRQLAFFSGILVSLIALGTLSGCGGNPQNRQQITGEVKLKGKLLDEGIIQFEPLDNQPTGDMAHIVQGKYEIPAGKGLAPGRYRVSIVGGDGSSGAGDASPDPPKGAGRFGKERIPAEYNVKSKIVKEITPAGPNVFDFDIK